jgi:Smg protein
MKDSLFEMLMNFFEKSLSQLKESTKSTSTKNDTSQTEPELFDLSTLESRTLTIKSPQATAMRIFTCDEKIKFTKASYQFLTRLLLWGIIAPETMELIINQLVFSESRFVTLQETKWTIRNSLADSLNASQLAFLDLVLYQKEDKLPLH